MHTRPASSPIKHRTVAAAILDAVRRRIMDGSYAAGSQLRQDGIADEFGVSRIPVREALLQLEAEGFVRILPHKGATVAALSAQDVAEAFELRLLLEPRLLRASVPHLLAADHAEIDGIVASYTKALHEGDTAQWGELNSALHSTLYRRAGKPKTLSIVTGLLQECDRYTRLQLSADRSELERADREHRELVRLCRAGAVAEAVALLKRHIAHVADALAGFLVARDTAQETAEDAAGPGRAEAPASR